MFVGKSQHTLDDKYRLVLPSRFREELGSAFFAFIDFDHCLSFYPREGYQQRADKILNLSEFSGDARKLKRVFFGNSMELCIDKVGRILLPKCFLEQAQIKGEVALVGVCDHLELWDRTVYDRESEKEDGDYLALAEKLSAEDHYRD